MKKWFTSHINELAITGGIVITCAIIVVVAIVINRTERKHTKTVAEETIQQETETITLKAVENQYGSCDRGRIYRCTGRGCT